MMSLWRETFGDSLNYVRLVFNAYYSPEFAYTKREKDNIVSAMLSVPYSFRTIGKNENNLYKSEYFCGLATRPEYRGKGFISSLMAEAEEKAAGRGTDFLTLIPATPSLREFYREKGWKDAFPRFVFSPTPILKRLISESNTHDIKWTVYSKNDFHHDDVNSTIDACHSFMQSAKTDYPSLRIEHSIEDLKVVFAENVVSGGEIIIGYSAIDDTMILMAVCNKEESGIIAVRYIQAQNFDVMVSFLKFLYLRTSGNFFVNTPFSASERKMLEKVGMNSELQRYAMIKSLGSRPEIATWFSDEKIFQPRKRELIGEMFLLLD